MQADPAAGPGHTSTHRETGMGIAQAALPGADHSSAVASARLLPETCPASVAAMKPSRSPSSTP